MEYNNTPVPDLHYSPSQVLNSRIIRLEPAIKNQEPKVQKNIKEFLQVKQGKTKYIQDHLTLKRVPTFKTGENVVFK